jgi:hypothetical protein
VLVLVPLVRGKVVRLFLPLPPALTLAPSATAVRFGGLAVASCAATAAVLEGAFHADTWGSHSYLLNMSSNMLDALTIYR